MYNARFIMMVGLPASGKTTVAKRLAERMGAILLSSDDLRKELFDDVSYQDKNGKVFEEMNRRTFELLKKGKDVIYDATNINSRRRKVLLSQMPKKIFKTCIFMNTKPHECKTRDMKRERVVGFDVIDRMYRNLQVPMYHEGFNHIMLYPQHHRNLNKKELIIPKTLEDYELFLKENKCEECINLPQDTPYHTLSVSRHMYYAYDSLKEIDNEDLKIALLLHDIGKPYCKKFKGKYASFRGHENVSAQMIVDILKKYNLPEERIIRIATLVQLHMKMHNKEWGSKKQDKFREEIGEIMWNDLVTLNNCDTMAK